MIVTPTSLSCYSILENNFQNLRSEIYDSTAIPTRVFYHISLSVFRENIFLADWTVNCLIHFSLEQYVSNFIGMCTCYLLDPNPYVLVYYNIVLCV